MVATVVAGFQVLVLLVAICWLALTCPDGAGYKWRCGKWPWEQWLIVPGPEEQENNFVLGLLFLGYYLVLKFSLFI